MQNILFSTTKSMYVTYDLLSAFGPIEKISVHLINAMTV